MADDPYIFADDAEAGAMVALERMERENARLRKERDDAIAERDRLREALEPFDGFPLQKWIGVGDDHVLYGPFTLGHVRKYLNVSCQGLLDDLNYPEIPDGCARAALDGTEIENKTSNSIPAPCPPSPRT